MDNREAPRRKLVQRSALLATAVAGVALVGSGVHGVASVDGSLQRAAAERDARQTQQLLEHRAAEQPPPRGERLRYRDLRGPRPGNCPFEGKRQRY